MVSIARQTLAVAILAMTSVAVSQPASEPAANRERQFIEAIEREQTRNGENSARLVEPLSDLAVLYQDRGDDALAIATIERALQIIRANDGVYSLEQARLLRRLIAAEESIGDAAAAWDLEQRLLTLAKRHPDDLRTVAIFQESAEQRLAFLGRYLAGESSPQIELGCYRGWRDTIGEPAGCRAGSKTDVVRAVTADAQRNYAEAIGVILDKGLYSSDELRDLEGGLLRSIALARAQHATFVDRVPIRTESRSWRSWLEAVGRLAHLDVPNPSGLPLNPGDAEKQNGAFDYLLARESLVRLFAYELAAAAPLRVQVEAFVRIADWDLLNSQTALALNEYAQVYRLLDERDAHAAIDELFAPPVPVVLTAFSPNPLVTAGAASAGYIDVAFEVTQFGESRHIQILDTTANVTDADKDGLVSLIKGSRFRPRASDGEPARASPVVVRYHLTA